MMKTEEIQEWLADFENRISFLENSLPGSAMSYRPEEHILERSRDSHKPVVTEQNEKYKQVDHRLIYQLRNEIAYLHNEVYELQKLQGLHGEVPKAYKRKGKYD